jgi:DNA-binding HxlR family transcriptional regulator
LLSSRELASLFHHRWAVPVLAELEREHGTRFVLLANRLGVPRETLSRTLGSLIQTGLVARNPGHGHPLRPEYLLTPDGARVAPGCLALLDVLPDRELSLKKWSVPVLAAVGDGARFSDLRSELPASPRALTLALKDLQALALVERDVVAGYPPTTRYRPTPAGRRVQRSLP